MTRVLCLLVLLCAATLCLGAENALTNGDFERDTPDRPPPGWAMWGADQWKVPANYTRDTIQPHSGQACLRMHHPANTAGYIVSAPDQALQTKPGMRLTVTFWARTDKPGPSAFLFTAYETINPYRDAPSPGSFSFEVGTEWQQFSYTVYEGWDYFTDQSKLVLLTFLPTRDQALEKTLWLDDVTFIQEPSTKPGRMLDERRLKYEPLPHRLKPGATLDVTVDAARPLRPATRAVGGISFHRVVGWTGQPYNKQGEYTLNQEVQDAIEALNLPMTRFYAVGEEPFGVPGALDRIVTLAAKIGVPQEQIVLELETQSATSKLPPEVWAQAAQYCRDKGYKFRYWEISNEPWIRVAGNAFPTADDYAQHVSACARAIRAVAPQAQIGMAITADPRWGNYLMKVAAGSYDFVAHHYYSPGEVMRRKFEPVVLGENYRLLDRTLQVNALLREYNPGREVYQYDTEWGLHSAGPGGERADDVDRNANIEGTLHRAVRLIYYAREGMLRGASSWQMLNNTRAQGFMVLAQGAPEKRSMLYWLYYYFNRHVGAQVLDLQGTAPYYTVTGDPRLPDGSWSGPLTPVLVTLSENRKTLYAVIANGSWDQTVPCQLNWQGFRAAGAEAYQLSSDDLDAKPLLDDDQAFVKLLDPTTTETGLTLEVPPHSVMFVRIEAR